MAGFLSYKSVMSWQFSVSYAYFVFHASWAALTFFRAVSSVNGGKGGLDSLDMLMHDAMLCLGASLFHKPVRLARGKMVTRRAPNCVAVQACLGLQISCNLASCFFSLIGQDIAPIRQSN